MRSWNTHWFAIGLIGLAALTAFAESYEWQFGSSLSYYTGDYGEDSDTDMVYIPLTIKRYLPRGAVSLVVPYISIDSPSGSRVVNGEVVATGGGETSGSGLGDILIKGSYSLYEQEGRRPFVDLTTKLKLPTADEADGLGTGEPDLTLGVELAYRYEKKFLGFTDLEYVMIGDPDDIDYDNRIIFDLGVGYDTPKVMYSLFYEYRTALLDSNDDPQSIFFFAHYRLRSDLRLEGMIDLGLSDGAADLGLTVGVKKRY